MLNAFITVTADLALEQAQQADAEITAGNWRGPLHGIPIALKDLIDVAGVRTTAASRQYAQPRGDGRCGDRHAIEAGRRGDRGKDQPAGVCVRRQRNRQRVRASAKSMGHGEDHRRIVFGIGGCGRGWNVRCGDRHRHGRIGALSGSSLRHGWPSTQPGSAEQRGNRSAGDRRSTRPARSPGRFEMRSTILDCLAAPGATNLSAGLDEPVTKLKLGVARNLATMPIRRLRAAFDAAVATISELVGEVTEFDLQWVTPPEIRSYEIYRYHEEMLRRTPELYDPRTLDRLRETAGVSEAEYQRALRELTEFNQQRARLRHARRGAESDRAGRSASARRTRSTRLAGFAPVRTPLPAEEHISVQLTVVAQRVGAVRIHERRLAGGTANFSSARSRSRRPAPGPCFRAGDGVA